jgi:hypothetical protein
MSAILGITSFVLSGAVVVIAVLAGASSIKDVRRKTGDESFLTSLLSGELFHR